jgi:hypothetical protein
MLPVYTNSQNAAVCTVMHGGRKRLSVSCALRRAYRSESHAVTEPFSNVTRRLRRIGVRGM